MVFVIQPHKFTNAYAAFLKRQGKLPVPGMLLEFPLRTPPPTSFLLRPTFLRPGLEPATPERSRCLGDTIFDLPPNPPPPNGVNVQKRP